VIIWNAKLEGSIRSKCAVDQQSVFVVTDANFIYRLHRKTGAVIWKKLLGEKLDPRPAISNENLFFDYLHSGLTLSPEFIYTGSGDSAVYSIRKDDGEVAWKFKTGGKVRSTPLLYRNLLIFGSWDHYLYSLAAVDGKQVWKFKTGNIIQSSPATDRDLIYSGSRDARLHAVSLKNGEEAWSLPYWGSWVESSPVLEKHRMYIGSSDFRCVMAIDTKKGKALWQTFTRGWSWPRPALSSSHLYLGTIACDIFPNNLKADFYCFNKTSGEILWYYPVKKEPEQHFYGFASWPFYSSGKVYVGGLDGNFYCFSE
jgi:outer membrane protein assembly factor BamB